MGEFAHLLVSGIMIGTIYGLVALGFVLIFKSSKIFNLAIGAMLMLPSYIGWSMLVQVKLSYWLGILITLAIAMAIGAGIERFPLRPMLGQPIYAIVMVTLAVACVLEAVATLIWGVRGMEGYPADFIPVSPLYLGNIPVSLQRLYAFISCLLLCAFFAVFFRYSRIGLNMRAVAEGFELAQSTGIRVSNALRICWMIAGLTCAVGGIFLGVSHGVSIGLGAIALKAFPAAIIGGLESLHGAIIGGVIIGVVEAMVSMYIGYGLGEIVAFLLVVLVLIIKPYGLFGLKTIERV